MPIELWSDSIVVVHVGDDPQFSEDLSAAERVGPPVRSAVLDFALVHFVNSSNISRLLRLRKHLIVNDAKIILCGVNTSVWGVFMITGLDKVFEFSENVTTALATLQMRDAKKPGKHP
jgi:anti-anti-sigma factor